MGSNEKGMRHDNSKILGFGLLALAALLVMKGKKAPGVGTIEETSGDRAKRAKGAFDALRYYYEKRGFRYRESATSESEYLEYRRERILLIVRCSEHTTKRAKGEKPYAVQVDLWRMAHFTKSAQETYEIARRFIDACIKNEGG